MKSLIILAGLCLVSCSQDDTAKKNTADGGFTCECVKGSTSESIKAKNPKEAQTACFAKGEGYKIKKCQRNKK